MIRRLPFLSLLLLSALAFAQDVVAPVVVAPAATTPDTILGWVWKTALALALGGLAWVAVKVSGFLTAKQNQVGMSTAQTLAWSLTNKVWLKAQAVGSKLLAKEKDLLNKILSDGVVTADEFNLFKSAIANDLRDIATEELPLLGGLIGGAGPVSTLIEGFASKVAHNLITGQTSAPTQTPLPSVAAAPSSPQ